MDKKVISLKQYGVNGRHAAIGNAINENQFKGRVVEALKNIEKNQEELKNDFKDHVTISNKKFDTINTDIGSLNSFNDKLVGGGKALGLLSASVVVITGVISWCVGII